MRLNVIRIDCKGLSIVFDRLICIPLVLEYVAEGIKRVGKIRFDGKRLGNQINGGLRLSHLMGDNAQQMQGVRLIGLALQNLTIKMLGVGHVTRIMGLQCLLKDLLVWQLFGCIKFVHYFRLI